MMVDENNDFLKSMKIKLYEDHSGSTWRSIYAEVNQSGDLVISAQDCGEAPRKYMGDDDYEWWVIVRAKDKDAVILALIERAFGGKFSASEDFRNWLKEKGIPSDFSCYS